MTNEPGPIGWPGRRRQAFGVGLPLHPGPFDPVRPRERPDPVAAKAGLLGLANVIAIEGAEHGILANTVLPWFSCR